MFNCHHICGWLISELYKWSKIVLNSSCSVEIKKKIPRWYNFDCCEPVVKAVPVPEAAGAGKDVAVNEAGARGFQLAVQVLRSKTPGSHIHQLQFRQ